MRRVEEEREHRDTEHGGQPGQAEASRDPAPESAHRSPGERGEDEPDGRVVAEQGERGEEREEGEPSRRSCLEGPLEAEEAGRDEGEHRGVAPQLRRDEDERREKRQQDEGHQGRGRAERAASPEITRPQHRGSERHGKQPQRPGRGRNAHPAVQKEHEERRVRVEEADAVSLGQRRRCRDPQMKVLVEAQARAARGDQACRGAHRDEQERGRARVSGEEVIEAFGAFRQKAHRPAARSLPRANLRRRLRDHSAGANANGRTSGIKPSSAASR